LPRSHRVMKFMDGDGGGMASSILTKALVGAVGEYGKTFRAVIHAAEAGIFAYIAVGMNRNADTFDLGVAVKSGDSLLNAEANFALDIGGKQSKRVEDHNLSRHE